MKIATFLAVAIGLAGPYTTAAPSLAFGARLASRASPVIINAPGVDDNTTSVVSVYACSDINFTGFCVFVRSFPEQCVQPPPTAPNANDTTSSVVPEGDFKCRFYAQDECDDSGFYLDVEYPGYLNLNQTGLDNSISSYKCSLVDPLI